MSLKRCHSCSPHPLATQMCRALIWKGKRINYGWPNWPIMVGVSGWHISWCQFNGWCLWVIKLVCKMTFWQGGVQMHMTKYCGCQWVTDWFWKVVGGHQVKKWWVTFSPILNVVVYMSPMMAKALQVICTLDSKQTKFSSLIATSQPPHFSFMCGWFKIEYLEITLQTLFLATFPQVH